MKRLFILLFAAAVYLSCTSTVYAADLEFPRKPIKVIVYTGPGGLIDVTARKFTDVARKYAGNAVFVVENKPGAGGLVAMKRLLEMQADGYAVLACTKSNISKLVAAGQESQADAFLWLAMMMADPECVITKSSADLDTWEEVAADAKALNGEQIWVGPAAGGLDHVMALKIWKTAGISAKWIPFKSGGKAKVALLGSQGVAYVGNPRDTAGNPDLKVAAVSAAERLPQFPDTPTFRELGIEGLDSEYMWRGFALKAGTPGHVVKWYDKLCAQVAADPEWREFWGSGGIDLEYVARDEFTDIVQSDIKEFTIYLDELGLLDREEQGTLAGLIKGKGAGRFAGIVLLINLAAMGFILKSGGVRKLMSAVVPMFLLSLSIVFALLTVAFPASDTVGPAVVPRLWSLVLAPLSALLLASALWGLEKHEEAGAVGVVVRFAAVMAVYLVGIFYLGYYISSAVFVFGAMYMLGYRRYTVMAGVTIGWLLLSYFLFFNLLKVPLPIGTVMERLF